jgi:hypothetical protein
MSSMLHILNAKILASEREREIRRQLRERAIRQEAEAAIAHAEIRFTVAESRWASPDRLCPDCPCRMTAAAR